MSKKEEQKELRRAVFKGVAQELEKQHKTPNWLCAQLDVEWASWGNWGKRDGIPLERFKPIAELLDLSEDELYKGKVVKNRRDIIEAPYVSIRASMGHGLGRQSEEVIRLIEISKNFLTSKFYITNPENIGLITAYGRSMKPTFNDGDVLVVDMGVTEIRGDEVYVIENEGEVYIKRVLRDPLGKKVTIISDNPTFPPIEIEIDEFSTLEVKGRVVTALDWKEI